MAVGALVTGALALVAASAAPEPPALHPFHTTVAEVELDVDTARLEVAMRAEGFVVEEMLTLRHARRVDLDKTPDVDDLLLEELRRSITVTSAGGEPAPLRWVGKQVDERELWMYFEADLPEGLHGATITNAWGLTFADDQVNTMHLLQAGYRATFETTVETPSAEVRFEGTDVTETLLWLNRRAAAKTTPADVAARLHLRVAEIAVDLGDTVAAGRALARVWPDVRAAATRAGGMRRVVRGVTLAERLAVARERRLLAARITAELERLAPRGERPDVALLDEVGVELELVAAPPAR